jgi:hypothetical protein
MRLRLVPVLIAIACAATGCAGPNMEMLVWRASHDLNCPENQIVTTPLDAEGLGWGVRGCGKNAGYSWAPSASTGVEEWLMTRKAEQDEVAP